MFLIPFPVLPGLFSFHEGSHEISSDGGPDVSEYGLAFLADDRFADGLADFPSDRAAGRLGDVLFDFVRLGLFLFLFLFGGLGFFFCLFCGCRGFFFFLGLLRGLRCLRGLRLFDLRLHSVQELIR